MALLELKHSQSPTQTQALIQMHPVDIVLGAQLGDEGKGRLIDILASEYDIVARCNSGGNAGHKVVVNGFTYAFHLVPSGILNPNVIGIIGNGCVINLEDLKKEIETIKHTDPDNNAIQNIDSRLFISDRAHIVIGLHKLVDASMENAKGKKDITNVIGTTKQGMGPVYSTKALRIGLRMCDLFLEPEQLHKKVEQLIDYLEVMCDGDIKDKDILPPTYYITAQLILLSSYFRPMIIDTITYINNAIKNGKKVLLEGAQAALLDIDFGVYPYCTSTTCTIGAICTGLGIPPHNIGMVNYVLKTYCTRVGNGPFPTEQLNHTGEQLQEIGHEYGTTTGRRRRCGWLDIPMVKWAIMINGNKNNFAQLCITKLDVFDTFSEIKLAVKYFVNDCELDAFPASLETLAKVQVEYETFSGWQTPTTDIRDYDDLPPNAKKYLSRIEELLQVPIKWIGVGAEREAMITIPIPK